MSLSWVKEKKTNKNRFLLSIKHRFRWLSRNYETKARFKRRILHAPNRIAKLSACKIRRLNQLNATYFNSIIKRRILHVPNRIEIILGLV